MFSRFRCYSLLVFAEVSYPYISEVFACLVVAVAWWVVENSNENRAATIKCGSKTIFGAKYANLTQPARTG